MSYANSYISEIISYYSKIVNENGKVVKFENIPTTTGIGDSTILKCTFENEEVFEIVMLHDGCCPDVIGLQQG